MRRYYPSLKKFWWIVLACVLLGALGGYLLAKAQPQGYVVNSTLLVNATAPGTLLPGQTAIATDSISQASDYAATIPSRMILEYVYQSNPKLKQRHFTVDTLRKDLTVLVPSPTQANILIVASAPTAADALLIANDVAKGFQAYKTAELQQSVNDTLASLQDQYNSLKKQSLALEAQILNYAKVNSNDPHIPLLVADRQQILMAMTNIRVQIRQLPPTIHSDIFIVSLAKQSDVVASVKSTLIIEVTSGIGLVLGLIFLSMVVIMDDRLRGDDQVTAKLGMVALGSLASDPEIKAGTIPSSGLVAEQIAGISANLRLTAILPGSWRAPQGTVLLVTSSQVGEGKSTLAAALAASVARGGRSVLVIDGDLRKPATHLALGMSPATFGLGDLLKATGGENIEVQRSNTPGVWLLPGGTPMDDGTLLLEQKLPAILAQLSKKTDIVIIDGPALLSNADASLMSAMADGVALVVDSRHDELDLLLRARDVLFSVTDKPVGVILNHLSPKHRDAYYADAYVEEVAPEEYAAV